LEGRGEGRIVVGLEVVVAVGDRLSLPVRVEAGQAGKDAAGGVRDENRVVVGEQGPVGAQKVEQVRHLLQVRGDVGSVTVEMGVVERHVDHVLDGCVCRVQMAHGVCARRDLGGGYYMGPQIL